MDMISRNIVAKWLFVLTICTGDFQTDAVKANTTFRLHNVQNLKEEGKDTAHC